MVQGGLGRAAGKRKAVSTMEDKVMIAWHRGEGLERLFVERNDSFVFTDYYQESEVATFTEPVQIIDPVNKKNNVSKLYTSEQADAV
jgi:hypothetical protein